MSSAFGTRRTRLHRNAVLKYYTIFVLLLAQDQNYGIILPICQCNVNPFFLTPYMAGMKSPKVPCYFFFLGNFFVSFVPKRGVGFAFARVSFRCNQVWVLISVKSVSGYCGKLNSSFTFPDCIPIWDHASPAL